MGTGDGGRSEGMGGIINFGHLNLLNSVVFKF